MRHGQRIGVVIPALDEERAIGRVLADIPDWVDQVVVADNGSRDATIATARAGGALVVSEPERGYGAACQTGIAALEAVDIVVFLDGDYSDHPQEMAALVDPIATGAADMVIGSRVTGNLERGALTLQQRFGNWLACRLIRAFWGVAYTDLGPFRAIQSAALRTLAMTDRNFGWTVEMQIKAAQKRLRSTEVPVSYRPRIGVSKVSGTIKGTVLAGMTILRVIGLSAWRTARANAAARGGTR
jgi:glycosyltransferase involved in cell wall biosynthesis